MSPVLATGTAAINSVPWNCAPEQLPDNYTAVLQMARSLRNQLSFLTVRTAWRPNPCASFGEGHADARTLLINTPQKRSPAYDLLIKELGQISEWIRGAQSEFMHDILSLMYRSASITVHADLFDQYYLGVMHRRHTPATAHNEAHYKLQWSIEEDQRHSQSLRRFFGYGLGTLLGTQTWEDMATRWREDQHGIWIDHAPYQIGFGVVGALLLYRDATVLAHMSDSGGHANGYVPIPEDYLIKAADTLAFCEEPLVGHA